jgi:type VI secretion system secreted protein VgrG
VATQDSRTFELKTPLGKDVLLLKSMNGREAMSQPFQWELDLLSEKTDVDPDDLLGKKVSIGMTLPNGKKRFFHGFVSEFSLGGWTQNYNAYRAVVRPWYWLLTRTADCKIFQERTVPQIFEDVVKQYGFTDYELKLAGSYEPWEYCVQYRETDFNFLSRLLEQEGIYYFFVHEEGKHTMVLADDPGKHTTLSGYETVPYYAPGGGSGSGAPSSSSSSAASPASRQRRERDHLEAWSWTKAVQPGSFATTDFDFEKPRKSLGGTSTISRKHDKSDYEIFDYPGELSKLESSQSDQTAKVRIQELQASYLIAHGHGSAAGLGTGLKFKLDKYPRKDLNIDYLITQCTYTLTVDTYESGGIPSGEQFAVALEAIDAKTPFRPERRTPKPVVQGAQTAMVVGKAGEEIFTDKYGRVKVQFHWDRYGKQDEKSSCWIRVAQVWAGKTWGAIHIPRIGQEVIVSFLEGDPDQPIITGRVYNGDSMPPYGLPANATQSGIKSRSSKGGGEANFNEIRFEDKKGEEQVYIHAEKNQDIVVEHDETRQVGHDQAEKVGHDRSREVGNDEMITIKRDRFMTIERDKSEAVVRNKMTHISGNQSENISGAMSIIVGRTLTESVLINYAETVGGAMELTVGAALAITVGAAMSEAVAGTKSEAIGGSKSESTGHDKALQVGKNLTETIKENRTVSVGKNLMETIDGQQTVEVKKESMLKAKKVEITADDEISLKTGDAQIIMKKNGDITIQGGKITIKASSDLILKGSKIAEN